MFDRPQIEGPVETLARGANVSSYAGLARKRAAADLIAAAHAAGPSSVLYMINKT